MMVILNRTSAPSVDLVYVHSEWDSAFSGRWVSQLVNRGCTIFVVSSSSEKNSYFRFTSSSIKMRAGTLLRNSLNRCSALTSVMRLFSKHVVWLHVKIYDKFLKFVLFFMVEYSFFLQKYFNCTLSLHFLYIR